MNTTSFKLIDGIRYRELTFNCKLKRYKFKYFFMVEYVVDRICYCYIDLRPVWQITVWQKVFCSKHNNALAKTEFQFGKKPTSLFISSTKQLRKISCQAR